MTFLKYFVTILGLLLAGGSTGWAADDSVDTSAAGTTTASMEAGPAHKTAHHKRHQTKTSATTNSAPVTPPATATAANTSESSSTTSSARRSGTASSKSSSEAPTDTASVPTTPVTPVKPDVAAAAGVGKTPNGRHQHHHTGSTTAAGTNTTDAPAATANSGTPSAKPATVDGHSAATTATSLSGQVPAPATATTAKGRHHRHGKTTAKTLPEPPIVVPNTNPSLATPAPPIAIVTLPTPPPVSGTTETSANAVPIVQTGLPVARPGTGTTATLPIAPVRSSGTPIFNFPFKDFPAQRVHSRTYPWKSSIVTTVFWIGEGSTPISAATNKQSAWDMQWVHHNGGSDDQNDMNGYAAAEHASLLNPFYVALPFNDLAYPEKTERWLPDGWYKPTHRGEKPESACQGRWLEIKSRTGRYCFAQWEDVGPVVTDDAEYVFGPERPNAMQGRGLDVSPAVAKYLGFDSTALTSWRFVDDDDVLPGMWLRYDEQALLFRAMKEQMHGSPTPRIQDLEEPVPDPDDSSQKKAGASRG